MPTKKENLKFATDTAAELVFGAFVFFALLKHTLLEGLAAPKRWFRR